MIAGERRFTTRQVDSREVARLASVLAVGCALLTFCWPAFAHAITVWSTDQEFGFGFLVLPVSVVLVWWRRRAITASRGQGSVVGIWMVAASVAASVFASRVGVHAVSGLAVCPLLFGAAVYLWGWCAGRTLAFPIGFLAFGLGLYRGLLDSVGFFMQEVTAVAAAGLADVMGIAVVREGLVLHVQDFAFIVAEQCSGMSSLLSLLALGALWVYVARGSLGARAAVILSVLPLVLVANTVRVALVLLVASSFGQEAALGFFHEASSLVLFGTALLGLVACGRIVGCSNPNFATSS